MGLPRLFLHMRQSMREPGFWAYGVWLDILIKNRRNRFGPVWLVMPTLLVMLVLGNIYAHLMGHAIPEYLPYLGVGYVHWRLFISVVNESSGAFTNYRAFIMDGRIRMTDYLLRLVARSMFHYAMGLLVVACFLAWSPATEVAMLLTLLVTLPLFLLNALWIAVVLSHLGARFPDIREMMGAVMMFAFLLTPILWYASKFPLDTTRGQLVRINPAFHLIELVRAPVLGVMPETTSIVVVLTMTVVGWGIAAFVYQRYGRYVPLWI